MDVFWLNDHQSSQVFYSRNKFPEDLQFQETANQESFQGRYVMRHLFLGELECIAAQSYEGKFSPLVA